MPRVAATVMVPLAVGLARLPGWLAGPLPLSMPAGGVTDTAARSTYFDRRAATVLYGGRRVACRMHRFADVSVAEPFRMTALEWLRIGGLSEAAGVLVVHLEAEVDSVAGLLPSWSRVVRWKLDQGGRHALGESIAAVLGKEVVPAAVHRSPFRAVFVEAVPPSDAEPMVSAEVDAVTQWLFALASAVPPGSFVPSSAQAAEVVAWRLPLSSDWSAMVLRDGAAFVGHGTANPEFVSRFGALFVRTIYTDALLLGLAQQMALTDLADRMADLDDPARFPRAVERLDGEFSRFRNSLWWQHLTQHGPGNELLLAFQRQHRLPELMEQVKSELEDYSRQASLRASRVLNVVVAVFALIGALGVVVDLYLMYRPPPAIPSPGGLAVAMLSLVVALLLVVAYPLGVLSRWLPHPQRPYRRWKRERRMANGRGGPTGTS